MMKQWKHINANVRHVDFYCSYFTPFGETILYIRGLDRELLLLLLVSLPAFFGHKE